MAQNGTKEQMDCVDVLLEVQAWVESTYHERIELGQDVQMPEELRERYARAFPNSPLGKSRKG